VLGVLALVQQGGVHEEGSSAQHPGVQHAALSVRRPTVFGTRDVLPQAAQRKTRDTHGFFMGWPLGDSQDDTKFVRTRRRQPARKDAGILRFQCAPSRSQDVLAKQELVAVEGFEPPTHGL
jgi:hypothetical protein